MGYGLEHVLFWWMLHVNIRRVLTLALVRWSILYISIRSSWLIVLFRASISLLILYLLDQLIPDRGIVKSLIKIVKLFFFHFCQVLLHMFWCSVVRCIHIYDYHIFLENWPLYPWWSFLLWSLNFLQLINCNFLLISISMVYIYLLILTYFSFYI